MKLLTIPAAIVAATISFNASAADSSHCNSLDHGPQFNKTELSEFDKCWINTHKADKKSGVDGNVLWIKVGDDFVSMPTKILRDSGSKEKAKAAVQAQVVTEVVTNTIIEQVNILTEDQQNALSFLGDYVIGDGIDLHVQNYLDARNPSISLHDVIVNAADAFRNATNVDGKIQVLAAYASSLNELIEGLPSNAEIVEAARLAVDQSQSAIDGRINAEKVLYNLGFTSVTNYDPSVIQGTNFSQASGSGVNIWRDSRTGFYHLWDPNNPFIDPTGRPLSHFLGNSINNAVVVAIETAIESAYDAGYLEGYNDGYEDGYNDGYADGYADGFQDGVASVQ